MASCSTQTSIWITSPDWSSLSTTELNCKQKLLLIKESVNLIMKIIIKQTSFCKNSRFLESGIKDESKIIVKDKFKHIISIKRIFTQNSAFYRNWLSINLILLTSLKTRTFSTASMFKFLIVFVFSQICESIWAFVSRNRCCENKKKQNFSIFLKWISYDS